MGNSTLSVSEEKITSLDISKLSNKNHQHLMRDIRKMEGTWIDLGQSKFGQSFYTNQNNRQMPMYELSKTESLYIATKFNDEARAKLILRWEDLEKKSIDFSNPDIVLQLVQNWKYELAEKKILQSQNLLQSEELKKQAPKINYINSVLISESTYNTSQVSKELGMSAMALNKILRAEKIQYKQNGTWLLYSKYQDKKYTKTKTSTFTDTQGNARTNMQTVWTEKGRFMIHNLFKNDKNGN